MCNRVLIGLEGQISQIVQEIRGKEHTATLELIGPSTKAGRAIKKKIGQKKEAMFKLLDEMYMWKTVGNTSKIDDHRMSPAAVKDMLSTGEGPWQTGIGAAMYWGKVALRCTSDLSRCREELPNLLVEKERLRRWGNRTLLAVKAKLVDERIVDEGSENEVFSNQLSSGEKILLCRWEAKCLGMLSDLDKLKW